MVSNFVWIWAVCAILNLVWMMVINYINGEEGIRDAERLALQCLRNMEEKRGHSIFPPDDSGAKKALKLFRAIEVAKLTVLAPISFLTFTAPSIFAHIKILLSK